jgi:peptidyl-prolyl cis-trans isomerase B (cyclophilin B)
MRQFLRRTGNSRRQQCLHPGTIREVSLMTTTGDSRRAAGVAGRKERQKQRQRKLARQRLARQETRRAQRDRRVRQWTISIMAAVAVIAVGVGTFFFVDHSPKQTAAAAHATLTPSPTPSATATPTPSTSPAAAVVAEPASHCTYTASPPAARKVGMPPARPDDKATYTATIHTNRGNIVISLLNSKATCTVSSFVYLAAQQYFSNTSCHRLTTSGIFVLQCGDPTGTGSGGPGYKFDDENLTGAKYTPGTLAMANSGPNTNGSQFFLVYKNSPLGASYTPFGTITSGLNIIQKVAQAGSDNSGGTGDGHPKEKVVITSVTIKKT